MLAGAGPVLDGGDDIARVLGPDPPELLGGALAPIDWSASPVLLGG